MRTATLVPALAFIALICSLALQAAQARPGQPIRGHAWVVDGDSLEIGRNRVRLWGIDAPEYLQTCRRDGSDWQCGAAAAAALRHHLQRRALLCLPVDTDRYGRTVARCEVNGVSVNQWLVHEGWALDYRRYSDGAFAAAQAQAQAAGRGIWASRFENPERYRREHR